jgi:hypothetical protein
LPPIARNLIFLTICALGAVTLDIFLKPPAPPSSVPHPASSAALLPTWLDDWRIAQRIASAEGKDILLEFTRPADLSTTGTPRATSSASVVDSDAFLRPIGGAFVLLRLTLSHDTLPEDAARFSTWATRLSVTKFPTFVLLDSHGTPYARSELVAKGAFAYLCEFQRLRKVRKKRDRQLALADATAGIERAHHLDRALNEVARFADTEYADLQERVTELDPQNSAGLRSKYETTMTHRQVECEVRDSVYPLINGGNYVGAIGRLNALVAGAKPPRDDLQRILAIKAELLYGLHAKEMSTKLLNEAIALDPKSELARCARNVKRELASLEPARKKFEDIQAWRAD